MDFHGNASLHGQNSSQHTGAYGSGSSFKNGSLSSANPYGGTPHPERDSSAVMSQHISDGGRAGTGGNRTASARVSYTDYSAYSDQPQQKNDMPRQNGANGNPPPAKNGMAGTTGAHYSRIATRNGSHKNTGSIGGGNGGNGKPPKKPPVNGNGSNGKGSGSSPKKPQSPFSAYKKKIVDWLKRVLRAVYMMGKPMRIFVVSAFGFVLICVVVIFSVSGNKHKRAEAMAAELALTTPAPTVAPTATPIPTPEPTPTIWIEKGAEGEDVMTLQKRLMELGYLAIDEPTSYFGNATKEAVKLFQRQHELQQDGICGNDTIVKLFSEDAKPYVMYEGAEGDDIQSFQEQLVELGYLGDSQVTGYYGTDTLSAVKKFQHRNDLSEDGKAGEKTLEAINSPDARVSYTKEQEIIAEKKKQAALARAQSPAGRIDKMISIAKKQLGDPYILGKSGPDSFDCSGLVYYCLRQVNVYTRRLNAAGLSQTSSWTKVSSLDNVKAGDLLFFKSDDSSAIGHVGIYIGGGEMIDASSANGKVMRRGAKTSYWRRNFVVARRPIE